MLSGDFMSSSNVTRSSLRHLRGAGLAVLIGALSTISLAAEPPLTLEQAQQIAVEQSRQLDAKDFAIQASREMSIAVRQLPDPVLSAGINNLPISGSDRFDFGSSDMTMREIGVMQEFTRPSKRALRGERFELEAEQVAAEKHAVLAAVERETALAWLNRYYAEAVASTIAEQERQARQELGAAEAAYKAGRGSQADVIAARTALAEIANRTDEVERQIGNAKIFLARWIGDAATLPLAATPDLGAMRLEINALETHLAHHPEIAALTRQEEVAVAEARLAQAEKKADWNVGLMYSQRGGGRSDMVSIGVSVPLQWNQKNRQDREVAAKLARVEQIKAEKDDMLRAHLAETSSMIREWQEMNTRLARYAKDLIPLANQRTEALIASYRGGKGSLTDVLSARRREIDVRLQALALEQETAQLWAHLNYLFPTIEILPASHNSIDKDTK
jgi:outer membrane protein TolC